MTNSPTAHTPPNQDAIAAQEAPAVNRLVFIAAGLGALLSALLHFLGAGDPATISMPVFVLAPMVPAFCAALVWLPLSFSKGTEARRQTATAAGVLVMLGVIFFFVEWSARFELSLYFALMLLAWGSRLKHAPLKWAALPYLAAAIVLRFLDFPGEGLVLLLLGVLTVAWPLLAGRRTGTGGAVTSR